jgi:hypothetical protein
MKTADMQIEKPWDSSVNRSEIFSYFIVVVHGSNTCFFIATFSFVFS